MLRITVMFVIVMIFTLLAGGNGEAISETSFSTRAKCERMRPGMVAAAKRSLERIHGPLHSSNRRAAYTEECQQQSEIGLNSAV